MADLFFDIDAARAVVVRNGFPLTMLPQTTNISMFWQTVVQHMENGLGPEDGLLTLVAETAKTFRGNREVQELLAEWTSPQAPPRPISAEGPCPTLTLLGAELPNEFLAAVQSRLGTEGTELLYVSRLQCAVSIPEPADAETAAKLCQNIQDILQPYAPGVRLQVVYEKYSFRPYLLSALTAFGPDTTPYLLQSVPATSTPGDIAAEIVAETRGVSDRRGGSIRTVIDAETDSGDTTRLKPDKTLHENNVRDKGILRVRTEAGRFRRSEVVEPESEPGDRVVRSPRILVMATEWSSSQGGLSTLNRRLCEALASRRAEVYCRVLNASDAERREASSAGVELITAARLVGSEEQEALSRRPRLPNGVVPDLIIGHGRITGRAAHAVAQDYFEGVPRLHLLHMAPDETEWLKLDRKNDAGLTAEQRMQQERELLCPPAVAAGIGPRLYDLVQAELAAFPGSAEPIRIDPGFDLRSSMRRTPPRGRPVRVLILGRMEDRLVKGIDLASMALANAIDLLGADASTIELVLRGVPTSEFADIRDAVHQWSGMRSLRVVPRSYTVDSDKLHEDLLRATLVLMPSRAEGFGLVGLEAILAGTPVLISSASGLGDLLREVLAPDEAARVVIPVTGDDDRDTPRWGAAIAAALRDPASSFANAEHVRTVMSKERTWTMAADAVLGLLK